MKILLWLDDIRDPYKMNWVEQYAPEYVNEKVVWVKNYDAFTGWIERNGLPDMVGFDHDLEPDHYDFDPTDLVGGKAIDAHEVTYGKTGFDCAKWLVQYVDDNDLELPEYFVQSANPIGKKNIIEYIENAKKHLDI